jgi:hypothetical protein
MLLPFAICDLPFAFKKSAFQKKDAPTCGAPFLA